MRGIHILESMDRKEKAFKCYCAAKMKLTFEKDASEEEKMAIRRGLKVSAQATQCLNSNAYSTDTLRSHPCSQDDLRQGRSTESFPARASC
jgi:hypothetical protein